MKYRKFNRFFGVYLAIFSLLFVTYINVFANSQKMKKIVVGSQVPKFELLDQNGKVFNIDSVLGKKNLVIYFYPKDDSPGCTKQACSFRDQFEVFKDADAIIIGISEQSVDSHLKFAKKYRLNYTLLSDKNNVVRKKFGVPSSFLSVLPGRVTYVVDKAGKVVYMFNSQLNANKHVEESLKIIKSL